VIVGSTNDEQFLTDPTGSRRFWCLRVTAPIDAAAVARDRDQLWAEAVAALEAGEPWWLSADEDQEREVGAQEHRRRDAWEDRIAAWLDDDWPGLRVQKGLRHLTTGVVLEHCLCLGARDWSPQAQDRVAKAMRVLGYAPHQVRLSRDEVGLHRKPDGTSLTRINSWLAEDKSQ
jgi:hypothetical protein